MRKEEEYIYTGIATFMSSPLVTLEKSKKYDVTIIGVPIDFGSSSSRLGTKYGPRTIREYSVQDRVADGTYYDLDTDKWIHGDQLKICDIGDMSIWPTNPKKNNDRLFKIISRIRKYSFPMILGGDHSITYSNFAACASLITKKKKIGLLHFDAHLDTEGEYIRSLPEIWHGNAFSKLIEEGKLDGKRMITIGPRGRISEEAYKYNLEKGITTFTSELVKKEGIENIMTKVHKIFSKDTDYIFLTIDIDCLDMAEAPGTGTPKYGGLSVKDLIQALIAMKDLPIIGMDLVEVNPKYDQSGNTAIVAGELIYNFLSFGFNKSIQKKL